MGKIWKNGNTKQWTWTTWCVTAIQEVDSWHVHSVPRHKCCDLHNRLAYEIYRLNLNIDTLLKYIICIYIYINIYIEHVYILKMLICFRRYCRVSVWCLWCLWCGWIHGTLPQAIEGQEVAVVAEELRQIRRRRQLAFLRWFRCKADAKI